VLQKAAAQYQKAWQQYGKHSPPMMSCTSSSTSSNFPFGSVYVPQDCLSLLGDEVSQQQQQMAVAFTPASSKG
jgi:hypothetical protein